MAQSSTLDEGWKPDSFMGQWHGLLLVSCNELVVEVKANVKGYNCVEYEGWELEEWQNNGTVKSFVL